MTARTPTQIERRRKGGVALAATIGGYVALCILAGLGAGFLLDRAFHTGPLFLICGVVIGFAVSFFLTYKLAMES
ncbi:MAG: AtpZ/AtpI family protein [Chloroflexota bacterium]